MVYLDLSVKRDFAGLSRGRHRCLAPLFSRNPFPLNSTAARLKQLIHQPQANKMSGSSSTVSSRRPSAAGNRRPSGGLGSRLQKLTGLQDAKDDPGMVQMEEPTTYRKGSVSQRRESHGAANATSRRASRASFTRCATHVYCNPSVQC